MWGCSYGGWGSKGRDQEPKRPNPNGPPMKGNPNVCAVWGSEGSKWGDWTYFTYFPTGHCGVATGGCSCTMGMPLNGYRVGPPMALLLWVLGGCKIKWLE